MYGAILGDIIGSPYEFDRGRKTKEFPFFDKGCSFTDDSVMTIAVAEALMRANGMGVINDEKATKDLIIDMMRKWGHRYPGAGYGRRFFHKVAVRRNRNRLQNQSFLIIGFNFHAGAFSADKPALCLYRLSIRGQVNAGEKGRAAVRAELQESDSLKCKAHKASPVQNITATG